MAIPKGPAAWKEALDSLPATPEKIPSFFFAHGSPVLAMGDRNDDRDPLKAHRPYGDLATFLKLFGPWLLKTYKPKAILVVSAHWETYGERHGTSPQIFEQQRPSDICVVTDYGDENPLLYDYYGFASEMYRLKFKSRGDSAITERVVQALKDVSDFSLGLTPA